MYGFIVPQLRIRNAIIRYNWPDDVFFFISYSEYAFYVLIRQCVVH